MESGVAATLEKLLPLASSKNAAAKAELQQKIQELPSTELGPLWKAVFDQLKTTVLQVVSEERLEEECLPLLALCHAAMKADTLCNAITNAAHFLNGVMPLLEDGELLDSIHAFCVTWCTKKLEGWKDLWLNTFIRSVQLSLRKHSKSKLEKLVTSVFLMKCGLGKDEDGLNAVELDPDECKTLYDQLAPCAVSPNYLCIVKGRKFISFLLTLHKDLANGIYKAVDSELPNMTSSQIQVLARAYISAWKAVADTPQATVLKENMQEIMHWAVNGDLVEGHHENLFKFLKVLHVERKHRPFSIMLCHAYYPILWRGLQARHFKVRHSASRIFFDAFPLLENTQVALQQEELTAQFEVMHSLLSDVHPDIRALAVRGVLKVMTEYYELFPAYQRKSLAKVLIEKNAQDKNSTESRIRVNQGLAFMVSNPMTHNLLKALIPRRKDSLYDAYAVQVSYVSLLSAARAIPGFKFWEEADPKVLLTLMATGKPRLSLKVATLLRNSYFNPDAADRRQNLDRCLLLYSLNPTAFYVFYSQLTHIAPLKAIVEFLVLVCKVLLRNSAVLKKTGAKENLLPDEFADNQVNDMEVYKDQKPMELKSVHILVETLAVTYSSLSMRKELTSDELKPHWKFLVSVMKKTVNDLFQTTDKALSRKTSITSERQSSLTQSNAMNVTNTEHGSLSLQISVLSAASLLPRDEASNLSLRCFSMLRNFVTGTNTGAHLTLSEEAKQCVLFLCNMHRAADVLGLVVESVEELQNKQTPVKQRRVRFCVERRPCNPELGLQVLRQLLESPHLQMMLLKHHTVPLFDTWNVLLRIADSLKDLLSISNGRMVAQDEMMMAFDLFLLLTYLLQGQKHPVTKEEFTAISTFERQMEWIQERLLPKVSGQTGRRRELSVQVIKIFLKVARSVFMAKWATFQFAEKVLCFLALCKEIEVDSVKEDIALIPPVMKKFMRIFVENEQQMSTITALLEKFDCEEHCKKNSSRRSQRSSKGISETNATTSAESMVASDGEGSK
ncbi:condensin-2 complex subunit G2-like isoform X1 [Dermacentor albipictus]|uniref:condensin-2 complex subunit G2-like isoform X1 n=1 Tax=Dermacentor albipictus TaxID=60249 RepID=UPI0038FC7C97